MIQGTGGPTPCELTQPFKKNKTVKQKMTLWTKKNMKFGLLYLGQDRLKTMNNITTMR